MIAISLAGVLTVMLATTVQSQERMPGWRGFSHSLKSIVGRFKVRMRGGRFQQIV
jgi:hypothetical protein